ncbi:MAG: pyridoxal phosphate-dependent aminotransferase [Candidatus Omnitrophota bacterium]
MKLASRVENLISSPTLAISAKIKTLKAAGKDIVGFGAGEPDFDTPDFIKQAAIEAINSGFTRYTPSSGIPELKQAIIDKFQRENNLKYTSEQIVVSSGAKHSLFNIIQALCEEGDEVIIPAPYWVSYPEMVKFSGAGPVIVHTTAINNFKVKPKELFSAITPKTKLIILNSPSNPTGSLYHKEELEDIARIAVGHNIFVISDEIYERLVYEQQEYISIAALNSKIYDLTITVNGVSKSFAMTGWRIGYCAARREIAQAIAKIQDHSTSNPVSISQKAALAALGGSDRCVKEMRDEFQKRRDFMVKKIAGIKKLCCTKPEGAFYIFCDISKTGLSARDFAMRLLEEKFVAVVPGEGFGSDKHIRLSFATSLDNIKKGLERIEAFIASL